MELKTRNINTAFHDLVGLLHRNGVYHSELSQKGLWRDIPIVKESSRNGNVLRIDEPVLITYEKPLERVLFNTARDVNPFALLYEALWMLAGRNDVAPLTYYTKQFNEYSDDGKTLNGAYGYRWRQAKYNEKEPGYSLYNEEKVDQLDILVAHLKAQPNSRRAILTQWNVEDDLLKIDDRPHCPRCGTQKYPCCTGPAWVNEDGSQKYPPVMKGSSRDVCCNLSVMFSLRNVDDGSMTFEEKRYDPLVPIPSTVKMGTTYLDMTVTNRSNDLIWGLLGANMPTFSILQEYMAARLGVEVGRYHHMSNNLHVYDWNWKPEEWLADKTPNYYEDRFSWSLGPPDVELKKSVPLVSDPETFEAELPLFVELFSGKTAVEDLPENWDEPFFSDVAQPMLIAFACYKVKDFHGAFACLSGIEDDAWRIVCENWMKKRSENFSKKGANA